MSYACMVLDNTYIIRQAQVACMQRGVEHVSVFSFPFSFTLRLTTQKDSSASPQFQGKFFSFFRWYLIIIKGSEADLTTRSRLPIYIPRKIGFL